MVCAACDTGCGMAEQLLRSLARLVVNAAKAWHQICTPLRCGARATFFACKGGQTGAPPCARIWGLAWLGIVDSGSFGC